MSRIQAAFDALGRELLDSEKPAVAAFRAKYSRKNIEAHASVAAATAEAIAAALASGDRVTYTVVDNGMLRGYLASGVEDAMREAGKRAGTVLGGFAAGSVLKLDDGKEFKKMRAPLVGILGGKKILGR